MQTTAGGTSMAGQAPAHLVGRLRMLVVDGVLAPDVPISFAEVADLLAVDSATAVAVLWELGRDGFLRRIGEDAVRVVPTDHEDADQIVQIRRMLEPPATRVAAAHARTADLITLRHLASRVAEAVDQQDYYAFRRADDAFAATLLSLHPNAELARMCTELRLRTAYDGLRAPVEYGVLGEVLQRHTEMVDLIESRDLAGVEALSLAIVNSLHFVGAPRMDAPHLVAEPVGLDLEMDGEFLEAEPDA
ncbi:MAG: GntR family transcriptional regulator [Propionibacteriaceae bacterium]|nr:GntR family transcriptional regulator [Propionibacteriaceae bacterium]